METKKNIKNNDKGNIIKMSSAKQNRVSNYDLLVKIFTMFMAVGWYMCIFLMMQLHLCNNILR